MKNKTKTKKTNKQNKNKTAELKSKLATQEIHIIFQIASFLDCFFSLNFGLKEEKRNITYGFILSQA